MSAEILHTCPDCGASNLLARGLQAHRGSLNCQRRAAARAFDSPMPKAPSKALSKPAKKTSAPAVIDIEPAAPAPAQAWAKARHFVELSSLHYACSCAAQVMAGMELLTLHKAYEGRGRRNDRNVFHDERSWPAAVKAELGVSEATAWRWMEMGREAKRRLAKDGTDLASLLGQPPSALTEAERDLLKRAVAKITDGHTQTELMLEWGIIKKGGGDPKPYVRRPALTEGEGGEPAAPAAPPRVDADIAWYAEQLAELNIHLRVRCTWTKLAIRPEECPRANLQNLHDLLAEVLPAIAARLEQHAR